MERFGEQPFAALPQLAPVIVGGDGSGVVEKQRVEAFLGELTGQRGVHDGLRWVPGGALGGE